MAESYGQGKNRSSGIEMSHSATLSSDYHISTDMGSNPGLRVERPSTNRFIHHVTLVFGSSVTFTNTDLHLQCWISAR